MIEKGAERGDKMLVVVVVVVVSDLRRRQKELWKKSTIRKITTITNKQNNK